MCIVPWVLGIELALDLVLVKACSTKYELRMFSLGKKKVKRKDCGILAVGLAVGCLVGSGM